MTINPTQVVKINRRIDRFVEYYLEVIIESEEIESIESEKKNKKSQIENEISSNESSAQSDAQKVESSSINEQITNDNEIRNERRQVEIENKRELDHILQIIVLYELGEVDKRLERDERRTSIGSKVRIATITWLIVNVHNLGFCRLH